MNPVPASTDPTSSAHGIGVDIGGTKIAAGLVAADGAIVLAASEPTPDDATGIAGVVATLVERLLEQRADDLAVGGIGIGAAGLVDRHRATVRFAPIGRAHV